MVSVSMFEAKTNLSKYVASVVTKEEPFIIIARNGKPVAKIVPYENEMENRIGIAKNKIPVMPSLEDFNSIYVTTDFIGNGGLL